MRITPLQSGNNSAKTIVINQFRYEPGALSVPRSSTVVWKNDDIVPHTATSVDGKSFDSGQIPAGSSRRIVLKQTGKYEYTCTLHPNMKGTLVVR